MMPLLWARLAFLPSCSRKVTIGPSSRSSAISCVLTRGAYCRFDPGAARQLADLLRAVAVYAAGGMVALESRTYAGAVKLLGQLR